MNRMQGGAETTDFAWEVHSSMEAWTSRADLKASILLAIQGGTLVAVITTRDLFAAAAGWLSIVAFCALVSLVAAMCLAAAAMVPALGPARRHRKEFHDNYVYFGHIRHWSHAELAARLAQPNDSERMEMLARQLIELSRLNWRKHRFLQASVMVTMLVVTALIGIAAAGHTW